MTTDSTFSGETQAFSMHDQAQIPTSVSTLDDLALLTSEELWNLYRQAKTPAIEDLDGRLVGRMLSVPGLENPAVAKTLKGFAASGIFPWQGKTFEARGDGTGKGINRVLGERKNWFRFATFIGASRAGDFDSLHLNYDNPSNPAPIRAVKDELREVSPGLWLGLAYLRLPGGTFHMALFFALTNQEAIQESTDSAGARFGSSKGRKGLLIAALALPLLAGAWLLFRQRK